jgi:hypothetical protein
VEGIFKWRPERFKKQGRITTAFFIEEEGDVKLGFSRGKMNQEAVDGWVNGWISTFIICN